MRHYRRFGRRGWPAPLDPVQRVRMVRAALALLAALLIGLAWEDVTAPPPAVAVPITAACVARGVELAVCVDVTRTGGDWRH